jgi:hypothetical protein
VSEDDSVERLSVTEAAERLGVTRDAIHKRIRMGSIEHEQGADGRFYVYVDTSTTAAHTSTDLSIDDRTDLLIAEMQDRIRSLEEANRENRRIIAALTQRIPAIEAPTEAPSEPPESPSESREPPESPGPRHPPTDTQARAGRRPQSDRAVDPVQCAYRTARPPMWFVAAPALLFGYGVIRLFDGLDGEYGPGLAWTIGHLLFLSGIVLFGVVIVRLGRLVPATTTARRVTASVAVAIALAGVVAFVRVFVLDLVVGFLAADNAEMHMVRDDIGDFPSILPEAVWDLGPLLFMVGLLTLTVQLAVLHPRRLAAWSPMMVAVGFLCIMINLNLLPVGAALLALALAPVAWRSGWKGKSSS